MCSWCKSVPSLFLKNTFPTLQFTRETKGITFAKRRKYVLFSLTLIHLFLLTLDINPIPPTVLLNQNLESKKPPNSALFSLFSTSFGKNPFYLLLETFCCKKRKNCRLVFKNTMFEYTVNFFQNVKLSLQNSPCITHVVPLI